MHRAQLFCPSELKEAPSVGPRGRYRLTLDPKTAQSIEDSNRFSYSTDLGGIDDKAAPHIDAVAFIPHAKSNKENALMSHVIRGGFGAGSEIVAGASRLGLDDGGIAKLSHLPVNLQSSVSWQKMVNN